MKIFGWSADSAGCEYYRLRLPLEALAARGHDVAWGERIPAEATWVGGTDIVIGQRVSLPAATGLWQRMAAAGKTLVYELDDDLLGVDPSNTRAHRYYGQANIQLNIRLNIQVATAVTVTTERLAELAGRLNPNVHLLPNCVPDWLLTHQRPHCEHLVVGWGGGASHDADFAECVPQLRRFLERHRDVEFHNIGKDYTSRVRGSHGRTRHSRWLDGVEDYLRHIDYDIGVVPLRPSRFNQCKSPIKAMELAALGIPVVASACGPYPGVVRHGETGFLVRYPHEWERALRALASGSMLRQEMGEAARAHAASWAMSVHAARWEQVYASVAGVAGAVA